MGEVLHKEKNGHFIHPENTEKKKMHDGKIQHYH
jgi:hypothetical protein